MRCVPFPDLDPARTRQRVGAWLLCALALAGPVRPAVAQRSQPPDTAAMRAEAAAELSRARADAYLDPGARELVARARARRGDVNDSITAYRARVRERISASFRALFRERLIYRREIAARVDWHRDGPTRVELLGAREAIPIALKGVRLPEDLDDVGELGVDPASEELLLGLRRGEFAEHPLAPDAELEYRYASGDTTEIRLPDGRTIRLLELRVQPRRDDFQLVSGSFWLDADTYDVVRAVYRPARPFDMERDLPRISPEDSTDAGEVPGILKPVRLDVRYVTVEYGLWDLKWWLPRLVSVSAELSAGRLLHVPASYTRVYDRYRVSTAEADAGTLPEPLAVDSAAPDSSGWGELADVGWKEECAHVAGLRCNCDAGRCHYYRVVVPSDSLSLLNGPDLPTSIFEPGEVLLSRADVTALDSALSRLPGVPLRPAPPRLRWGPSGAGLLRYNRIEGLSVGARVEEDLGPLGADATVRLGSADLRPEVEVGASWQRVTGRMRVAAYRRLAPVQEQARPLGLGNSLQALLFGLDDGDYYRALGAELTGMSRPRSGFASEARLFVEHQSSAEVGTQFSLRHVANGDFAFRANPPAATADLAGAGLTLRLDRGLDAAGFRWGGALRLETAAGWMSGTGDVAYLRPALRVYTAFPLPARLLGALEAEAGTSAGTLPPQRRWELGGPGTLRGYGGGSMAGTAFWRARAEMANDFPAARLAVFSDIGWAGPRDAFGTGSPLLSAGIGASFLDGVLRVDLARALRGEQGWRLALYVDGVL